VTSPAYHLPSTGYFFGVSVCTRAFAFRGSVLQPSYEFLLSSNAVGQPGSTACKCERAGSWGEFWLELLYYTFSSQKTALLWGKHQNVTKNDLQSNVFDERRPTKKDSSKFLTYFVSNLVVEKTLDKNQVTLRDFFLPWPNPNDSITILADSTIDIRRRWLASRVAR
jgi:hypothetical protein